MCLFIAFAHNINAQQISIIKDSIQLDEVIVTGTSHSISIRHLPMSISVVNNREIKDRIEPSLLPLLTEEVPGLFITQRGVMGYGVAAGAAGGMNVRGIGGAPSAGVLVLIDGNPQYMGLMGHPLADSYQSLMAERVEVIRGPASMLYGSNAMGGVINIITKKAKANENRASGQIMYGSYNTLSTEVSAIANKGKLQGTFNIGYNRSDGHRQNMDFEQLNGYGKLGYQFNSNWTSHIDMNLSSTESSNPGTVTNEFIDNDAHVMRGVVSAALQNEFENTSGELTFFLNFGAHEINDGYKPGGSPLPYRFHSTDQMMGLSAHQSYSLFTNNQTTAGIDFQKFGGRAWNKFPDQSDNITLADLYLYDVAGYVHTQQSVLSNKLWLNAGVRLDYHETSGTELIPQVGVSFSPASNKVLKAMVSKGFRNATIREMYMFPPQNPDLKPERLMNYELSYTQNILQNKLSMGLNVFYIDGENMIQLIPVADEFQYMNSGKVENKGFEISSKIQVSKAINVSGNYSYLNMKYALLGAPKHKLYIGANFTKERWNASTGVQIVSKLYTLIMPEEQTVSFNLWNARVNYKASSWLTVFAKGENLLGEEYEMNAGYPMPQTTIFGGLRVQL
ncbi:MAG TPA: TonB-dependent receptor [Marinilabiliaceae bacterium]|nr:TonB-dependent receptor [Marinilabiliaceae bacterium]